MSGYSPEVIEAIENVYLGLSVALSAAGVLLVLAAVWDWIRYRP